MKDYYKEYIKCKTKYLKQKRNYMQNGGANCYKLPSNQKECNPNEVSKRCNEKNVCIDTKDLINTRNSLVDTSKNIAATLKKQGKDLKDSNALKSVLSNKIKVDKALSDIYKNYPKDVCC